MDNIEQYNGGASFVSAREVPWHELGTVVDHSMTAQEAIRLARLDWEVKTMPVFAHIGRTDEKGLALADNIYEIPNKRAIYRNNPVDGSPVVFNIMSNQYSPVQNVEAFAFLDNLLEEKNGAHYETAGALGQGERVFMAVKMPESMTIDPGGAADEVQPYILVTNCHDGTGSFTVAVTPIRVVCQNTLSLGLRMAHRTWKTSHTGNVTSRMAQARNTLTLTTKYLEEMMVQANQLVTQSYTKDQFNNLVKDLFPIDDDATDRIKTAREETHGKLNYLFNEASTQENIRGTKWAAYNSIGEYLDWTREIPGKNKAERLAKDSLFGKSIVIKQKALVSLGAN